MSKEEKSRPKRGAGRGWPEPECGVKNLTAAKIVLGGRCKSTLGMIEDREFEWFQFRLQIGHARPMILVADGGENRGAKARRA
jgi:hypothetical protein